MRAAWDAQLEENRAALTASLRADAPVASLLTSDEAAIAARAFEANTALAADLAAAASRGELLYGPRKLLPFWVVFHWNRWALDDITQRTLVYFMSVLLSPKGDEP